MDAFFKRASLHNSSRFCQVIRARNTRFCGAPLTLRYRLRESALAHRAVFTVWNGQDQKFGQGDHLLLNCPHRADSILGIIFPEVKEKQEINFRRARPAHEKEVSGVKIIIEADAKEVAALVVALQERRKENENEGFKDVHINLKATKSPDRLGEVLSRLSRPGT